MFEILERFKNKKESAPKPKAEKLAPIEPIIEQAERAGQTLEKQAEKELSEIKKHLEVICIKSFEDNLSKPEFEAKRALLSLLESHNPEEKKTELKNLLENTLQMQNDRPENIAEMKNFLQDSLTNEFGLNLPKKNVLENPQDLTAEALAQATETGALAQLQQEVHHAFGAVVKNSGTKGKTEFMRYLTTTEPPEKMRHLKNLIGVGENLLAQNPSAIRDSVVNNIEFSKLNLADPKVEERLAKLFKITLPQNIPTPEAV